MKMNIKNSSYKVLKVSVEAFFLLKFEQISATQWEY